MTSSSPKHRSSEKPDTQRQQRLITPAHQLLLLSDLHLSADTPHTLAAVCTTLIDQASPGTAFALLGDIFEYWVGDDHDTPVAQALADACQSARNKGAELYFMHGNRDFLVGEHYLKRCGMSLLPDPWHGVLFDRPTTLSHGDMLCTDDHAYQQFRQMSRNPQWQAAFLGKPLTERVAYAQHLRTESMKNKAARAADINTDIMDVNALAVSEALAGRWPNGIETQPSCALIHGHTHRPAVHAVQMAHGMEALRWVLPDWDFDTPGQCRGHLLKVSADGISRLPAG